MTRITHVTQPVPVFRSILTVITYQVHRDILTILLICQADKELIIGDIPGE
jgi:hypothetical protein